MVAIHCKDVTQGSILPDMNTFRNRFYHEDIIEM